jgi:putative MATE family efflux protein
VIYAFLAGVLVSVFGLVVMDGMFALMAVPPDVARIGHQYLATWLLGGPLVFGFFAIEATFRASGDTRTPMLLLVTSVALSVTLDPLDRRRRSIPAAWRRGAAATSVMVRGGGFLIGVVIAFRRGLIRLDVPDWRAIPTMLRVGAPLSSRGALVRRIHVADAFYVALGTPALAALGVGHKVEGLGFIAISGFAISAAALVGQNIGARQEDRARQGVRLTILYCLLATVPTALAFVLIPEALDAIFTPDPGGIEDGSLYLRIIAFAQIGQTFEIVFEGALAGAGYTFWPMLAGTVFTALRIPLAAWWSGPLGLFGIWLALSLTAIARGAANTLFWLSGTWRRSMV